MIIKIRDVPLIKFLVEFKNGEYRGKCIKSEYDGIHAWKVGKNLYVIKNLLKNIMK